MSTNTSDNLLLSSLRCVIALGVSACVLGVSAGAMAQEELPPEVELDTRQIELNNEAVQALSKDPPNTRKAIELAQAALVLGEEGDLLLLTLGRAYQLGQKCVEADQTYARVGQAPRVKGLPRDFVKVQLRKYRQELEMTCPGTLEVTCKPKTLELTMRDEPFPCGEPVELVPGQYTLRARNVATGATVSLQAQVKGLKAVTTEIELAGPERKDPDPEVTPAPAPEPVPGPSTFDIMPYLSGGACPVRLLNQQTSATATDLNLCGALGAEFALRTRLTSSLGVGGRLEPRLLGGSPTLETDESVGIRQLTLNTSAGLWIKELIALEVMAQFGKSWFELNGADFGSGQTIALGPGLRLDTLAALPDMPRVRAHARFGLGAASTVYYALGISVAIKRLVIGFDYEGLNDGSALVTLSEDVGEETFGFANETLLLRVGFEQTIRPMEEPLVERAPASEPPLEK